MENALAFIGQRSVLDTIDHFSFKGLAFIGQLFHALRRSLRLIGQAFFIARLAAFVAWLNIALSSKLLFPGFGVVAPGGDYFFRSLSGCFLGFSSSVAASSRASSSTETSSPTASPASGRASAAASRLEK